MESLGKEHDLDGKVVHQGIAVYGNKGSTDQHAYVQQLRDGRNNFFVTFIEVLARTRDGAPCRGRAGRHLRRLPRTASCSGTRAALYENGRESITHHRRRASTPAHGRRAHRAVRARRRASTRRSSTSTPTTSRASRPARRRPARCWRCSARCSRCLGANKGEPHDRRRDRRGRGAGDDVETVFKVLEHLAANPDHGVTRTEGKTPFDATYGRA